MAQPLHRRVIPETFVQLLFEYLDARGVMPETVLGESRPLPQVHGLDGFPIDRWVELLARAARHLDDPLLGLHLGQTVTPRHLGVLGYVLLACPNLAAVLQRLDRYQRLVYDVTPMTRREGDGYVELVWGAEQGRPGALADEAAITALMQFCGSLAGAPLIPLRVQFINPPPSDLQPYLDYFGCPVAYGQDETVIRLDVRDLALPLKTADPGLIEVMERQADKLLEQLPQKAPLIEQVRKTTARLLHVGEPSLEQVAAVLCCAPRTVQRRLNAAGSSFRQELAWVRRKMAEGYLRDPRLSIADIALLLGYSEHSAFSRSYKEWTGVTPRQWRDAGLLADEDFAAASAVITQPISADVRSR